MRRWLECAATTAGAYGLVLTAAALIGGRAVLNLPYVTWPAVAVLCFGAALAAVTVSPWSARVPPRAVTIGLWTVAGVSLALSCWVLLDLISLVLTGRVEDPDGNSNWLTFAERLAFVLVGVLFSASAVAWHRHSTGACARCGRHHPPSRTARQHPAPHAAPPGVRKVAYVGSLAFLPYLSAHTLGAFGVAGIEPAGFRPPLILVVPLVGAIGLAVFLLLGLVRPWGMLFPRWTLWLSGRRVPRSLPLTPVWVIAPTLGLYGIGLVVIAALLVTGVMPHDGEPILLIFAAGLSFGGYGTALAIAAISYQHRSRPVCVAPACVRQSSSPATATT